MATILTGPAPENTKKPKAPKAPRPPKEPRAAKPAKAPKPVREKTAPAVKAPAWASPVKPSLVLLPAKSRGLKARRLAVRRAMLMSLGLLGATTAAYLVVVAGTAGAQAEVDREAAVTARQTAFLAENRPVQDYADGFLERKAAAATALEQDTAYSRVVDAIQSANTVGAEFTGISTAEAGISCVSPSPFTPSTALGCMNVSGKAPSVASVGTFVAALQKDSTILKDVYLTESASAEGGIAFKISVGYTDRALTFKGQKYREGDDAAEVPVAEAPATGPVAEAPATTPGPDPEPEKETK